jgi:sec-independent protein translocase protein TatB
MFDIAWSELLLIAIVALIFIGPKELPQLLHTLGRMAAKARRTADDFRRQFDDSVREAGYEDLHKNIQQFRSLNPTSQIKDSIARAINDYNPNPVTPPAPEALSEVQAPQSELKAEAVPPTAIVDAKTAGDVPAPTAIAAAPEKPAAEIAEVRPSSAPAQAGEAKDRIAPAA